MPGGGGNVELLFNGYRVTACDDENVLNMNSAYGFIKK